MTDTFLVAPILIIVYWLELVAAGVVTGIIIARFVARRLPDSRQSDEDASEQQEPSPAVSDSGEPRWEAKRGLPAGFCVSRPPTSPPHRNGTNGTSRY